MSNSKLVSYTKLSPNCNKPRNHVIDTITPHCVVGQCSVETIGNIFAPTSRKASSTYGIGPDGRVGQYVDEADRSWCSSSPANDNRAITIEIASDTTHPYAITDKAMTALIDLCADICKRNGIPKLMWKADKGLIGKPEQQNITVHRWFENKACPGDYIYERLGYVASEVNKRLGTSSSDAPLPGDGAGGSTGVTFGAGDTVAFSGGAHYTNANAETAADSPAGGTAKVTATAPGSKHPYHIVHADGASSVYGWVDASTISPDSSGNTDTGDNIYTVQAGDSLWSIAARLLGNGKRYPEIQKLNNLSGELISVGQKLKIPGGSGGGGSTPEIPTKTLKEGCTVRLNNGAKTYTGGSLASFVYNRDHVVKELNGDRAVITYGGVVVAAVRATDLTVK